MMTNRSQRRRWIAVALGLASATSLIAACSDDSSKSASSPGSEASVSEASTSAASSGPSSDTTIATTATTARPAKAAIDLSSVTVEPIGTAGKGVVFTSAAEQLGTFSYTETEYLVAGRANTYTGPGTGPATVATKDVPYVTRIIVRVPTDRGRFSGRVLVEPFNTSAGRDADVTWKLVAEQIAAHGDAWVGVTERVVSVAPLKEFDAARYARIDISTNGVAWDVLTQIGGLLKEGAPKSPLGELAVQRLYMTGFSQNGIETATYLSAFHTTARMEGRAPIYDGYLPMGRSGSITPLDSGTASVPKFEHLPLGKVDVPVVELETQTDVEGFSSPAYTSPSEAEVRRDDSDQPGDLYRLYEISGAPHVPKLQSCQGGGSTFPLAPFTRAAYVNLIRWAEDKKTPPRAERIQSASLGTVSPSQTDSYGNALGGVRSPWLDVPLAGYAAHSLEGPICQLVGVETPLDAATVQKLYPDAATYLQRFTASLDDTIAKGFLLASEREALIEVENERAAARFATK